MKNYGYFLEEIEKMGLENVKNNMNDIEKRATKFIMEPTSVTKFTNDELISP